jgi:ribosome assembly protein 4
MFSLSTVRLKLFSASGLQQDALPHYQVRVFIILFYSLSASPYAVCQIIETAFCSGGTSAAAAGHSSPILCAAFSPTGDVLATGSGDTNARLWDLGTEMPSHVLSGHKGWVLCVEWEARERTLATGGHDGHVRVWDPKTGKPIGDAMKGHTQWITSLSWEPIHM